MAGTEEEGTRTSEGEGENTGSSTSNRTTGSTSSQSSGRTFTQEDMDRAAGKVREEERRKLEREQLAEQGKYQSVAAQLQADLERRQAEYDRQLAELKAQLDREAQTRASTEQRATRLATVLETDAQQLLNTLPEEFKALLPNGLPVEDRLTWLRNAHVAASAKATAEAKAAADAEAAAKAQADAAAELEREQQAKINPRPGNSGTPKAAGTESQLEEDRQALATAAAASGAYNM